MHTGLVHKRAISCAKVGIGSNLAHDTGVLCEKVTILAENGTYKGIYTKKEATDGRLFWCEKYIVY